MPDTIDDVPIFANDLFPLDADNTLADKIAELEKQLEAEKDRRREDRFVALVIFMILMTALLLDQAQNSMVVVVVFVLELIILIAISKRLGIQQIAGILDRLLDNFAKKSD